MIYIYIYSRTADATRWAPKGGQMAPGSTDDTAILRDAVSLENRNLCSGGHTGIVYRVSWSKAAKAAIPCANV